MIEVIVGSQFCSVNPYPQVDLREIGESAGSLLSKAVVDATFSLMFRMGLPQTPPDDTWQATRQASEKLSYTPLKGAEDLWLGRTLIGIPMVVEYMINS